jgi:hypothetical protein
VHGIGITGHIHLTQTTARLVQHALTAHLSRRAGPVHGVTCLAQGPDQMFAAAIRRLGGTYDVVLPAHDYRERMGGTFHRRLFDELLDGAAEVISGPFAHSSAAAYAFANAEMMSRCGELVAVWDGRIDERPGTTAHAVGLAEQSSLPITRIWPAGAQRSRRPVPERLRAARFVAALAVGSATS